MVAGTGQVRAPGCCGDYHGGEKYTMGWWGERAAQAGRQLAVAPYPDLRQTQRVATLAGACWC
jgi:hypothetical protein